MMGKNEMLEGQVQVSPVQLQVFVVGWVSIEPIPILKAQFAEQFYSSWIPS